VTKRRLSSHFFAGHASGGGRRVGRGRREVRGRRRAGSVRRRRRSRHVDLHSVIVVASSFIRRAFHKKRRYPLLLVVPFGIFYSSNHPPGLARVLLFEDQDLVVDGGKKISPFDKTSLTKSERRRSNMMVYTHTYERLKCFLVGRLALSPSRQLGRMTRLMNVLVTAKRTRISHTHLLIVNSPYDFEEGFPAVDLLALVPQLAQLAIVGTAIVTQRACQRGRQPEEGHAHHLGLLRAVPAHGAALHGRHQREALRGCHGVAQRHFVPAGRVQRGHELAQRGQHVGRAEGEQTLLDAEEALQERRGLFVAAELEVAHGLVVLLGAEEGVKVLGVEEALTTSDQVQELNNNLGHQR